MLNSSPDAKLGFERFLEEHGYQVAPVTIDNMEVNRAGFSGEWPIGSGGDDD